MLTQWDISRITKCGFGRPMAASRRFACTFAQRSGMLPMPMVAAPRLSDDCSSFDIVHCRDAVLVGCLDGNPGGLPAGDSMDCYRHQSRSTSVVPSIRLERLQRRREGEGEMVPIPVSVRVT